MNAEDALKYRNNRLLASDWTQTLDAPFTDEQRQAWATYRQQLRDLPQNPSWPDVQWPIEPA
jgi:hypothetical protein